MEINELMTRNLTPAQLKILELAGKKDKRGSCEFFDHWNEYDDYSDGSGGYYDTD